MLELLSDPRLESDYIARVSRFLRPLKQNEDMIWLRVTTIRQFSLAWTHGSELVEHADGRLGCHGNYQIFEVTGLNPEAVVDYYDDDLCMYCKANRKKAFFIYSLTDQYQLPLL